MRCWRPPVSPKMNCGASLPSRSFKSRGLPWPRLRNLPTRGNSNSSRYWLPVAYRFTMALRSSTKIFKPFGGFLPIDCRFRHLSNPQSLRRRPSRSLRRMYQQLLVPPAVATELRRNGVEHRGQEWLLLREPANKKLVAQLSLRLHPGEAEAIAVAFELRADRVLIDERRARRVAVEFRLQPFGLLGVLAEGKQRGFLPECKSVLDDMIQVAGFWIGERRTTVRHILQEIGEAASP